MSKNYVHVPPAKGEDGLYRVLARIESTMLGVEDHGVMTAYLHMTYGGSGQGVGGYILDKPLNDEAGKFIGRQGTAAGMEFVRRMLVTCGVEKWEDLPGRLVYVLKQSEFAAPVGIEPLPTDRGGERFLFSDLDALFAAERGQP